MKTRIDQSKLRMAPEDVDWDEASLVRKQKQLDFGKNTHGYSRYVRLIPRSVLLKFKFIFLSNR